MINKLVIVAAIMALMTGCASVPMESPEVSNKAKEFNTPSEGMAGLYIYRPSGLGAALMKDIWVDEKCVGQSAQNVFFYEEVLGGVEHKVSTESEFSPNDLFINAESGENYFIEQFIKMGVFVGGADLRHVSEAQGKHHIAKLGLAKKGSCSGSYHPEKKPVKNSSMRDD